MWKPEHRLAALRRGLRYPSDMTVSEWTRIAPLIPPAGRGGRPRDENPREVLNAIFYGLATGCQGQALPKDLQPKSTAHHDFMLGTGTARWRARSALCRSSRGGRTRGEPNCRFARAEF